MKFNDLFNDLLELINEDKRKGYLLSYESQVMPMNKPISTIPNLKPVFRQFNKGEFQSPEMAAFKELASEEAFNGMYEGEGLGFGYSTIRYIYPTSEAVDIIMDQFKEYLINNLKFEVISDEPVNGSYRTIKFFKPDGGGAALEAIISNISSTGK